jgi:hypothetical protein
VMTGIGDSTTTSSQHGHRFSKSPEELLNFSSLLSASPHQFFNNRMKEHRFEYEMLHTKIKSRIGRARLVFEQSLKDHSRSNENELKAEFEQQISDFILESCDKTFLSEFGEQIYKLETADKRLEFIREVFDSESKEEKQARAKSDLDSISRKSNTNEKFNTFLGRVRSLAELVSEFKDAQNFITNEAFKNAINPENRKFLKDHLKWNESCENIAQFLDARDRYIQAPKVATVAIKDQLAEFIDLQSGIFERNMAEMKAEAEKDKLKFTEAINALTAQIAAVKTMAPKAPPAFQQNRPNFSEENRTPRFSPNFQNTGPRHFEPRMNFQQQREQFTRYSQNQNSQGIRQNTPFCSFCRSTDHSRRFCPQITCFHCNQKGHKSFDCRERQNTSAAPKNFEQSMNPFSKDFVPQKN